MIGKILTPNLISGDDGKRYNFDMEQIKNIQNPNAQELIGAQVDFMILQDSEYEQGTREKQVATDIYVLDSTLINASNVGVTQDSANSLKSSKVQSAVTTIINKIRKKIYTIFAVNVFTIIFSVAIGNKNTLPTPIALGMFIVLLLILIGIICLRFSITLDIKRFSNSKIILKNLIVFYVMMILVLTALCISIILYNTLGLVLWILFIILTLVFLIYGLYRAYKYYKEIAYLTDNKTFVVVYVLEYILCFIPLVYFIGLVLECYCWHKTTHIKQAQN